MMIELNKMKVNLEGNLEVTGQILPYQRQLTIVAVNNGENPQLLINGKEVTDPKQGEFFSELLLSAFFENVDKMEVGGGEAQITKSIFLPFDSGSELIG
ncbi:MAG: hypothetical protein V1770_01375 [bacterium]